MLDFRETWVILLIRWSARSIRILYRDCFGDYSRPFEFRGVRSLPRDIIDPIADLVKMLPEGRLGIRNDGPVPLPIFVRGIGPGANPLTWSQLGTALRISGIDEDRLQFVHLTGEMNTQRPPFRLPFNVLALGDRFQYGLAPLMRRPWFASDRAMRQQGVTIEEAARSELRRKLQETRQDVLFLSERHSSFAYHVISGLALSSRPRLIVDRSAEVHSIPDGVSVLHAPGTAGIGSLGTEVLFGLIHDLPLHEMLRAVTRRIKSATGFSLYSNPRANHDLRIMDAYRDLRRQVIQVQSLVTGFEPQALEMVRSGAPALRNLVQVHSGKAIAVGATAGQIVQKVSSFNRETSGLVPLVKARIEWQSVQSEWRNLQARLRKFNSNPIAIQLLATQQKRAADVALERLETLPHLSLVSQETSLQAGARYQVRVHVGNTLLGSLMKGQPTPLDLLLPASKYSAGHKLMAVVQEKEFQLISGNRQSLFLPRYGASKQVYFEVRAPRKPGRATLRILLFHRNQLLQAFLLTSTITLSEQQQTEPMTQVELEFSQTSRFTNLDEIEPRALSIVANDNLNGTHEFFVFGKSAGKALLGNPAYPKVMDEFRAILKEASLAPDKTNVARSFPPTPPGEPASPVAADFFRRLADKGRETHTGMFSDVTGTPVQAAIRRLRDAEGQTIQIVRIDKRLVIPWSLLYDYDLPETGRGDFCLGLAKDQTGQVRPCSHGPKDKAYCIKGFWGFRLIVEERISNGQQDDGVRSVPVPVEAEPLCVAMDVTVTGVAELYKQLKDEIGEKKVAGPVDAQHLIELLWDDPPKRPTVLVVLGHLETQPAKLEVEPNGERIVLVRNKSWLTHQSISDRFLEVAKQWDQPRPLVLLMACSVAATTVSKMNDFMLALNNAGAGAIVGTECVVFANLVCPFAEDFTLRMWKPDEKGARVPLGRAMHEYRVKTLQAGNPLAFVFRSVGNADLTLET